jgi:hypothetical protein
VLYLPLLSLRVFTAYNRVKPSLIIKLKLEIACEERQKRISARDGKH